MMQVEILPGNIRAWNIFWDQKHSGAHMLELYHLELNEEAAGELLLKLRVLSETTLEIEAEKVKEMQEQMKRQRSRR